MSDTISNTTYADIAEVMFSLSDKVYYYSYNSDDVRASAKSCLMVMVLEMMHDLSEDRANEIIRKASIELNKDGENTEVA